MARVKSVDESPFRHNFYISEALRGAQPARIIPALRRHKVRVFVSDYILKELEHGLINYFGVGSLTSRSIAERVGARCLLVRDAQSKHIVRGDAKDTPILRAAMTAKVDYLVSNDRELLSMNPHEGVKIISTDEFERLLRSLGWIQSR